MLHGHGDDAYRYGKILYNFSSNVYPYAELSGLLHRLSEHPDALASYPDPAAETLSAKIASLERIEPSSVCVTNGATEAIYLIALAWRAARSAVVVPTFAEYADSCRLHAHRLREYS
ncbi:MAG TPA: aminotransferase class I/II-fold pyridoxal phosphate-dependent enzyme, partial [Candidatus Gallibacteroides avistercoris]|nr:aminotransferase class I/II-fold pyridoxal phosphate-dependent enzyme [Candidatus Gallibacteroides avistercoris]